MRMSDLIILKGDLQKIIAVNANEGSLHIDRALALIGAFMLQKQFRQDWKEMDTYLKFLHNNCLKRKGLNIKDIFSDCVFLIQDCLSKQTLEKKKGTLSSLDLRVIKGVEENGYLSFNNITFATYASQTTINSKPANNYVVDSIAKEIHDEETDHNRGVIQDEPTIEQVKTSDTYEMLVAKKNSRSLNTCTDNFPFIQLYKNLINNDQDNRKKAKYTWQWLLTLDEYNAIKECVRTNKIPSPKNWDSKTVRLLALYIGEFYKREYENRLNPFNQFEDNSPNYGFDEDKKICEALNIKPYRKTNQAHKYSLYVSGGLPVHYISTKLDNDKSNSFIDALSKLFDAEDSLDIEEGEELLEKVNNTALRESYHNQHSIYTYIQTLMSEEKAWDDSDRDNVEFCNFIKKVKEASYKAQERKKFKIFYSLWTFLENSNIKEFYITPQLRFNPEENGERHYAISKQRLENWGIKDPSAQFSLKIGDTSLIFTFCYNGDYISRGLVDRIDLPILDKNLKIKDLFNPDYTIIFDDMTGSPSHLNEGFYHPFKDGYMQLYTDDDPSMASWNSYKGAQVFRWSGVLYDKNRYQLLSQNMIIDINEQIGWVTFADSVTFEDTYKGKTRTFFNSKGSIYAKPSNNSLHTAIIDSPCLFLLEGCILDGQAECAIGDEKGRAYIVKSNGITFDIFRAADDEKVYFSPVVEFKSASSYRDSSAQWQEYDSKKTKLNQGLYVFRLSRGCYMTEVKCYVLPQEANISFQNKCKPYLIKFCYFTDVTSEGIVNSQKENSVVFRISNNNNDKYTFTLGDDDGHITLQTYHPKAQTHLYLHGQEITDKPIIMAYAEDIEVNYISAQNCNKPKCRLSDYIGAYKRLFGALTATATKTNNIFSSLTQGFDIKLDKDDPKSKIKIRIYTQDFQNNNYSSDKMMLLDLKSNKLTQYHPDIIGSIEHDSLLFQSLKDVGCQGGYYAPKFIPKNGQRAANDVKVKERQTRLTEYADKKNPKFVSDYAYQQFKIAVEHKLYFAVFDSLLSMCWDSRNKSLLEVNKTQFKKNLFQFIQGYVTYTHKKGTEPSITGLRRLAREFLFDWSIIKTDIENSNSDKLKELYQIIINK